MFSANVILFKYLHKLHYTSKQNALCSQTPQKHPQYLAKNKVNPALNHSEQGSQPKQTVKITFTILTLALYNFYVQNDIYVHLSTGHRLSTMPD